MLRLSYRHVFDTWAAPSFKRPFLQYKKHLVRSRLFAHQVQDDEPGELLLDIDDIQGDCLVGFNKPYLAILAIDIVDDKKTKNWLNNYVIPQITSARDVIKFRNMFRSNREYRGGVKPTTMIHTCTNISFSYNALLKLAPQEEVQQFYKPSANHVAFKHGMTARSAYLQDPSKGIGASKNWVVGADGNPDILIQIASDRQSLVQEEIDYLKAGFEATGNPAVIKHTQFGKRREDFPGHDHFGFKDGISNPGVRGKYELGGKKEALFASSNPVTTRYLASDDPRDNMYGLPGQNILWPGEFILGLPKQYGDIKKMNRRGSTDFIGPSWAKNGSYLVYRRLKQDVAKFWHFLRESAADIATHPGMENFTEEHFGAKLVGRWKSGTPIIRSPSEDNTRIGMDKKSNNAFEYASHMDPFLLKPHGKPDGFEPDSIPDPFGKVYPIGAHLRKVQPRDESTDIGSKYDTLKRRIIRRGNQYGDAIADVRVDDGVDRGLLFVCYQSSIDDQFEFLITRWANSETNPSEGGGHDLIIGQSDSKDRERKFEITLADGTSKLLKTTDEWVIPTGGGYFFLPSISALKDVIAN